MAEKTEKEQVIEVNWADIRYAYLQAEGNLNVAAAENGITVPMILLQARMEGWGERGSRKEEKALNTAESKSTTINDVVDGHKAGALNIRELIASSIDEVKNYQGPIKEKVLMIKTLSEALGKVSSVERQAHEIDTAASDSPDAITITMGGKTVEICSKNRPKEA